MKRIRQINKGCIRLKGMTKFRELSDENTETVSQRESIINTNTAS